MLQKIAPEVEFLCSPRSSLAKRQVEGFLLADLMGELLRPGFGDYQSQVLEQVQSINPTISANWAAHGNFDILENIGIARFYKDGTVVWGPSRPQNRGDIDVAGVFILPREAPLDAQIGANSGAVDTGHTDLNFDDESGIWRTYPSLAPGEASRIYNISGDTLSSARTRGNLPANRMLRLDLVCLGLSRGGNSPGYRVAWGDKWAVTLHHGAKITIDKLVTVSGADGPKTEFRAVRTLHNVETVNLLGGHYRIYVQRLAGRLVVSVGDKSVWLFDGDAQKVRDVTWPAAPLRVAASNCRVALEVAVVKFSSPSGVPFTANLSRTTRTNNPPQDARADTGGWKDAGTAIDVSVTPGGDRITYAATLRANRDGIDTPFFDKCLIKKSAVWTNAVGGGINLSRSVRRWNVSLALPPVLAGSEAVLDLDGEAVQKVGGWQAATKQRCPAQVRVRWSYSDGSRGAWSRIFAGEIYEPGQEVAGYRQKTFQFTLRDPIARFQRPAGLIDHRFGPMEFLFLDKMAGIVGGYDPNTGRKVSSQLFGAEIVQEIVRAIVGPEMADRFNGNGDPLRFLPSFQPPLLSSETDIAGYLAVASVLGASSSSSPGLLSGGWLFPPPFGDDGVTWIDQFASDDFALFYFGWPDGDTSGPICPIYGNYANLIAARKRVHIYDSLAGNDGSRLVSRVTVATRPEKSFNRWLAWGNLGQGMDGLEGLIPAFRMAEARLDPDDQDSAENSYELTELIRTNFAAPLGNAPGRGAAEAIVTARRDDMAGVSLEWPNFTFRGDETAQPGDLIQPHLTGSNASLGFYNASISGTDFRAEKITHEGTQDAASSDFNTTVETRPLSNYERGIVPAGVIA